MSREKKADRRLYHPVPISLFPGREVLCAFREERISRFGELGLLGKVGELDSLILRQRALCTPTAIYQGVNRRLKVPDDPGWYAQEKLIATICKPDQGVSMVSGRPMPCAPPPNSVLLALIRQVADPGQRDQIKRELCSTLEHAYLLYWWEWVEADPDVPTLPENHETRFREKWSWP